jgi:hypothetical protein
MRRRRLADLAVAALAALVVATVVRGAIGLSRPAGPAATHPGLLARTPTAAAAPLERTASARTSVGGVPTILFVGEAPALRPRGGAGKSFACKAANALHWRCQLLTRVPRNDLPTPGPSASSIPGGSSGVSGRPTAAYVVVTTAADDTVPEIRTVLDSLPVSVRSATTIVLGPITGTTSARIARLISGERRLAAEHKATFIDPVAEQWITAATRASDLDGEQLSGTGIPVMAARLASDLGRLEGVAGR